MVQVVPGMKYGSLPSKPPAYRRMQTGQRWRPNLSPRPNSGSRARPAANAPHEVHFADTPLNPWSQALQKMFPVENRLCGLEIETIGVAILALPGVELPIGAAVATIRAVRCSDRYKGAAVMRRGVPTP